MHSATLPTLQLQGIDRARYFAPVVFFGFLAALCLALITVSPFLVTFHDAAALRRRWSVRPAGDRRASVSP